MRANRISVIKQFTCVYLISVAAFYVAMAYGSLYGRPFPTSSWIGVPVCVLVVEIFALFVPFMLAYEDAYRLDTNQKRGKK